MKILSVKKGSQAEVKGLQSGDIVVVVNNSPARDYIDFMFYGSEERVHLKIQRESVEFSIDLTGYEDSGIEFEPMKITSCRNHCIFCFVDQNPAGMRKEIYVKDEDYRLSFLHGSYITLNNLTEYDCNRIVTQHLSPLYVSVHATEVKTRMKLLGRKSDDKMIETMDCLLSAGITMHCQIVVCPGINDDAVLEQTVYDLHTRYPSIISVAVIPVGLTKQREKLYPLKVMDEKDARTIIERIDRLHERFAREN
ncbi:MAG TPA: DUF512 domain-containing protein, partial [Anaerolineae bacterium]|nr:DUF512 domain-containing protein [Anaerolineae bacterium]